MIMCPDPYEHTAGGLELTPNDETPDAAIADVASKTMNVVRRVFIAFLLYGSSPDPISTVEAHT